MGTSIFARIGLLNATAIGMRNVLCTITDAKYGLTTHELRKVDLKGLGVMY